MAQVSSSTEPAPGVVIDQGDGKITITITTKSPSDDRPTLAGRNTRGLWHAAYKRLRMEPMFEAVLFEATHAKFLLPYLSRRLIGHSFRSKRVHNVESETTLNAIHRWTLEEGHDGADYKSDEDSDEDDREERERKKLAKEEEQVGSALLSAKAELRRSMQDSPGACVAWFAVCLCIQKLCAGSEASGLAYIVSRITYYDRLSLLLPTIPDFDSDDDDDDHDDEIDNPLYAALVSLYAAVLNQLILVIWANRMPHESGTEDDSPLMFGHTGMGFDSAAVHPIVVLESSVMEHARDKALEESIAELVRLLSLPPTSSDENGGLDNNARDPTIATDNLDDGNNHNDLRVDTGAGGNSDDRKTKADADDQGHNASSGIRGVLCAAHIQPPHSPPSDASPAVLEELYQWALEQDEFQKWLKAHATDRGSPDDRILLVHNPRSTSITMLLVDVLSEKVSTLADTENKVADMDAGRPRYALARASSDWSRDIDGTSVVSVVRDLIWIVLQNQPELKSHLENAVQTMNRRPLLGGDDNETKATSAVRGSSCDFYAALALLCRIVEDTRFQPTCFVVDYVDVMLDGVDGVYHSDKDGGDDNGKGDESERGSANVAQNGTARTSRKRGWTVRDLMALVRTTCSLSRNVSWVVLSSSMESSFLGDVGGRRLVPSPADSTLAEITHHFLRALLQQHLYPTYTSELLDELADIAHVNSDGVVSCRAFAKDLVDVPPEAMVDILSTLPRDDRLELQRPLSWIYDGLRSKNLAPIGAINDPSGEQLTHTVINAFQPLTALELTALTSLPGAVDAILRTPGIVRPVVDVREVHGGSGQAPDYYFCSSQASGAKRWVDSVDHTKMVVRHLRCLAEHYDASVPRREAQLSIYVKTAWLRHLDRVDDSALRLVQWLGPLLSGFVTGTAEAWLNDLETLGVTPVVWGMLQDLLPSPSTGGTLSPIAAALEALVARIAASEAMTVTPAEARQFLHMAGWYAGHDKPDTDKILPVLPQSPPVSLPGLPAPGNAELAEAKRKIGSLVGHTDKVCDCYWSYDGRLLVTISDDDTLQCWDRATLRRQCVTNHTFQGSLVMLSLSRTDPNALIALSRWEVVQFDLAKGAVPVARKSYSEVVAAWQAWQDRQRPEKQKKHQAQQDQQDQREQEEQEEQEYQQDQQGDLIEAPDETDSVMFSYMQFSGNDSSSLIVTCNTLPNGQTPAVVLRVPQLELQEVRYIEYGYKCLPSAVANALSHAPADDALQESDCLGAAMAHDLNLAAIVREDGSFDIYDTELAVPHRILHLPQANLSSVHYVYAWRLFTAWDDSGSFVCYFVHDKGKQTDQRQRGSARELAVTSYRPPHKSFLSYAFTRDRDEVIYTFSYKQPTVYKVTEEDTHAMNEPPRSIIAIRSAASLPSYSSGPFTSMVFYKGGTQAATANTHGEIHLWSLPTTNTINAPETAAVTLQRTIQETTSEVNWLSLSSNEELLMACYDSGKTDIWSTESGERVANLTGHNSWVRMAAFSPGNTLVATASFDGLVRLWDVEACRRAYVEACRRENQALEEVRSDDDSETGDNKTEGRLFDDNGDGQNAEDGKEESSDAAATDNIMFVTLEDTSKDMPGTVAFSPDGRFLATTGRPGHIWDILRDPDSTALLPTRKLVPCATLNWEDKSMEGLGNDRNQEPPTKAEDNDQSNNDGDGGPDDNGGDADDKESGEIQKSDSDADSDDDNVDDNDDSSSFVYVHRCFSFVFSPDSRALFGFCNDGRLLVWRRILRHSSVSSSTSSPSSSSVGEHWDPRATVVAGGFSVPGQDTLWDYQPRRLSISEGVDGQYLLHTEIGVWVLPWPLQDDNLKERETTGLKPSPHHPCHIASIPGRMAIFWKGQLLSKFPDMFAPTKQYYFSSYACGVYTTDSETSTLITGTKNGKVLCFRYRDRESGEKTADETDTADSNEKQAGFSTEPHDQNGKASENEVDKTGQTKDGSTELVS